MLQNLENRKCIQVNFMVTLSQREMLDRKAKESGARNISQYICDVLFDPAQIKDVVGNTRKRVRLNP